MKIKEKRRVIGKQATVLQQIRVKTAYNIEMLGGSLPFFIIRHVEKAHQYYVRFVINIRRNNSFLY